MRVGLVSPYDIGRYGGVQDQIKILARALERRGYDTRIVAPGTNGPAGAVIVGSVTEIPGNGSTTPLALSPRAVSRTIDALADVDVVHIHEPFMPMVSLGTLLRAQSPMVGTFHADPPAAIRAGYRGLRTLLRRLTERMAVVTAVSPIAAAPVAPFADVRTIPNALEFDDQAPPTARNEQRVAFLGRNDPRKGLAVLLEAWPRVRTALPKAELIVIGSEPVRNAPPDVVFHGRVSDDRKRNLLAASGVFCAPNTAGESFGVILVEAMGAGCAVVASALPGFEHVLGDVGVTVPPGDVAALASELTNVLTTDDTRVRMQQAGLARSRRFDIDSVVELYEVAYDDALRA